MGKNILGNQKGQSTVEFSFAFLILIVLVFALGGLAEITYHWVIMQYAASEAARYGSLGSTDPGLSREASIQNRVNEITNAMGVDDVIVTFQDESGGATAGLGSQHFAMTLSRPLQLIPFVGNILQFAGLAPTAIPIYQVTVRTVIRNEPF